MSGLDKMSWLARRLSVMGPREIMHRSGEQLYLIYLKVCYQLGFAVAARPQFDYRDFAFCCTSASRLPDLYWDTDAVVSDREALLSGDGDALGCKWQWTDSGGQWRLAPDTGKFWPEEFFASVDYREGNPYGDIRIAWEPSRLQQLVSLALLAVNSDAETGRNSTELLCREVESWIDDNPPLQGIHYISSMECALRIVSVCHALDMVRDRIISPERLWNKVLGLIDAHASLIYRRMSLYSSSGNHTVAECVGLVYAGVLFPEFHNAARWIDRGLRILNAEVGRQILADGGGAERALWYHLFVTDLCGLAHALLKNGGYTGLGTLEAGCRRARKFLSTLARDPAHLPAIGDSDNGHALSKYLRISWDGPGEQGSLVTFEETGLSVVRDKATGVSLYLDHGPLGMPPCFGHGHADGLSVTVSDGDAMRLNNAGTYTYTGDADWRKYFRGTRAHNTLLIDGEDQAKQMAPFMWSDVYNARLAYSESDGAMTLLLAFHDGYYKSKGAIHWRGIIHPAGGGWVIWDCVTGNGTHHLELNWHTRYAAGKNNGNYFLSAGMALSVEGGEAILVPADDSGHLGWMSEMYGVKYPGKTISTTYNGALPHEFTTLISSPGTGVEEPISTAGIRVFRNRISETRTY